jgi:AcrR family transcriptional regulator
MAAAQVSTSTFYYYVRSKEELARAVLDTQERSYWKHRLRPTIGKLTRPTAERLHDWFESSAVAPTEVLIAHYEGALALAVIGKTAAPLRLASEIVPAVLAGALWRAEPGTGPNGAADLTAREESCR